MPISPSNPIISSFFDITPPENKIKTNLKNFGIYKEI
jgi:hypothetical protein